MRILFLSPRLCWPLRTGARVREYHLARALGRQASVTYVSFIGPGVERPAAADLPFFADVHLVPLEGLYSPLKILRGLAGRWPLTILNYTTSAMKTKLSEIVARQRFDVIHVDGSSMAAYVPFLQAEIGASLPAIYDWHNIDSEVLQRFSTSAGSAPKRAYAALTARRLAHAEREILRSGSGHAVCSEREKTQLLSIEPKAPIAVIENGVDCTYFAGAAGAEPRRHIVFVGSMDYAPNVEAAVWFARRIWPGVRERLPDCSLVLVGSNPAPAVRELASEPDVEVTGTVPDVRPYYDGALAAIVPLRTGGGTRLKILEAMAAGVPVVSSGVGAEGLAVTPGADIDIVEAESEWIRALAALAEQSQLWSERAACGLRLVQSRYDWQIVGNLLYENYQAWVKVSAPPLQ